MPGGDAGSGKLDPDSSRHFEQWNTSNLRKRAKIGDGTFFCPMVHCQSRHSDLNNFRRHIRHAHPKSIHAIIFQAALYQSEKNRWCPSSNGHKSKTTLPKSPSEAGFLGDFDMAMSNTAKGAFGHRSLSLWHAADHMLRTIDTKL